MATETPFSPFLLLKKKKIVFLNGKKSTIPAKQQEENTLLWFSNFQDTYNKIEILMKFSWIHQTFIQMVLFIAIPTLARWPVQIHQPFLCLVLRIWADFYFTLPLK